MEALSIKEMRKQVKKSIESTDDTTIQMIHAILEVSKKNAEQEEDAFNREMQRRIDDYEMGIAKTLTFEEIVESARKSYRTKENIK